MQNQTAFLVEAKKFEIKDTPMPKVGADDLLIEVKHIGVCGSDVLFFNDPTVGGDLNPEMPMVLGHECGGVVIGMGENVSGFQLGDVVALEPGVPCGKCEACKSGHYNQCTEMDFMASPPFKSGALHRYVAHPAQWCYPLGSDCTTLDAAMLEPFSVGLYAARRAGVQSGESALILGSGCIGIMTVLALNAAGVKDIIIADVMDNRLEMAEKIGTCKAVNSKEEDLLQAVMAMTGGKGVDYVFECAGAVPTVKSTYLYARMGGKVVFVGQCHQEVPYYFFKASMKEVDFITILRYCNAYPVAKKLTEQRLADPKKVVTNVFRFEEIQAAFECALYQKDTALKVVLEY